MQQADHLEIDRPRLPPRHRREIRTSWMTERMRRGLGPSQVLAEAVRDEIVPKDIDVRSERVVQAYDRLISMGFVTRSEVYFSIPGNARRFVEEIARDAGQYWAPGRRSGLHRLIREQPTPIPHFETEMCIRFGPIESLYGDLYANLRRYELLLWALIRGVLGHEYGEAESWKDSGWWRDGLPEDVRRELAGEWGTRDDLETPWHAATFGTMLKVVEKHRGLFARLNSDDDGKLFGSQIRQIAQIRNAVMHPLSGRQILETEFEAVFEGLLSMVNRTRAAREAKCLDPSALPSENVLVLPELLHERLFPLEAGRLA